MEQSRLVALSNEAYTSLQQDTLNEAQTAAMNSLIESISPIYREVGDAVCAQLCEFDGEHPYSDADVLTSAYEAIGTIEPNETIEGVSLRALSLLLSKDLAEDLSPEEATLDLSDLISESLTPEEQEDEAHAEHCRSDYELCQLVAAGDPEATQEFYDKYHRLVYKIAGRYAHRLRGSIVELDDVAQEIFVKFLSAARTYNTGSGTRSARFSTYALAHIETTVNRAANKRFVVKLPEPISKAILTIHTINADRMAKRGAVLTDKEIAELLDLPLEETPNRISVAAVRRAMMLTEYIGSIDSGYAADADHSPGNDYILDERNPLDHISGDNDPSNLEDDVTLRLLTEDVNSVVNTLSEREADIVRMTFGFGDQNGKPASQEEIAEKYGLTTTKVSQLFSRAMSKLRYPGRSQFLQPYIAKR